tara:strand:- start:97 stop:687 length:591 start_codon:yes stop_codon:yes gene_type:complete
MVFWTDYFELPQEDIDYIRETYKTEKFIRQGGSDYKHYTGYYHSYGAQQRPDTGIQSGSFVDTRLQRLYAPVLKNIMRKQGLFECEQHHMLLSYQQLWVQLYTKEFSDKSKVGCTLHNHYTGPQNLFSWVHFVDVPDEKCFYWQAKDGDGWGEKQYPELQSTGHLVVFPSWCWHGVDRVISQSDRVVVAGNILRLR